MTDEAFQWLFPFVFYSKNYLAMLLIAVLISALGLYAVCKRVVFVGMALAEISAAGIGFAFFSFSVLAGYGLLPEWWHQCGVGLSSILFALLGVLVFALWHPPERFSRESVIGAGYAVASSLALLLVWKSAEGLEELNNLLHGDVLFVTVAQVSILAATTMATFTIHGVFAKEILFVAYDRDMAISLGYNARGWELLLFGTLGLAIALSTWIGGLLMVFGLLVLPALGALGSREQLLPSLSIALLQGMTAVTLGFILANIFDNPTPPMVVLVQLSLVILLILGRRSSALRLLSNSILGIGLILTLFASTLAMSDALFDIQWLRKVERIETVKPVKNQPRTTSLGNADPFKGTNRANRLEIIETLKGMGDQHSVQLLVSILQDADEETVLAAIQALGEIGDSHGADPIWNLTKRFSTDDTLLEIGLALLILKDQRGALICIDLMAKSPLPFIRSEALLALTTHSQNKEDLAFQPLAEPTTAGNMEALRRWRKSVRNQGANFFSGN
jgi:ABC-type Mn2+/Zn2+ transport system permease subunit